MKWFALTALILAGSFAGCKKESPPPAAAPAPAAAPTGELTDPTNAQPKLKTVRLWLGAEELETELALTPMQNHTGMMFRTNMPENTAMLFVFGRPWAASFYMKNTTIPLSCAYIDPEGSIVEINDLKPLDETPVVAASDDVQYVLEVNQGWFQRHKISPGTMIRTEYGSFPDTFFNKRQPAR
jgi:uncharacterized membrane protein (UPF0127 family)